MVLKHRQSTQIRKFLENPSNQHPSQINFFIINFLCCVGIFCCIPILELVALFICLLFVCIYTTTLLFSHCLLYLYIHGWKSEEQNSMTTIEIESERKIKNKNEQAEKKSKWNRKNGICTLAEWLKLIEAIRLSTYGRPKSKNDLLYYRLKLEIILVLEMCVQRSQIDFHFAISPVHSFINFYFHFVHFCQAEYVHGLWSHVPFDMKTRWEW